MSGLLTAGSGRPWENDLVAELSRPGAPLPVIRRCVDVSELLAVASTGQASVAVVSADLRRLSSDTVGRLVAAGISVVGVYPAGDERARVRLERMGVPAAVADDVGALAITDLARTAALDAELGPPGQRSAGSVAPYAAGPVPPTGLSDDIITGVPEPEPPAASGTVLAVWGPAGAPGRTTVALNLAAEAAEAGVRTLLIDADVYGGVVANALGLLDESPGLAGACRQAANGRLDRAGLAGLSWQVGPLRVLTGIARADRWPEVRPSAVPAVLDLARASAELVVVDCAFAIEADEEISFDTAAPRRNGATLTLLEHADGVLVVGAADPPGVERLVRGLAELGDLLPQVDPRVLLNKQRRTAAGADEAVQAVSRFAGVGVLAVLPEDRAATDKAWRSALPLLQAAPASPLRSAIRDLFKTVAPVRVRADA